MSDIKVLIVDDEKLIREGLKLILSTYKDIEVVGMAENGDEALKFCQNNLVDVVLMDIRMPICNGVLGTRIIKESFKDIKILVLTTFNDGEYIHEALKHGASGYLLKDSSYDVIYEGIKSAYIGNIVVHPEVATKMVTSATLNEDKPKDISNLGITEKEINIIKEVAKGFNNKEIGEELHLSEGTIKNNITFILSKLNLRDRAQLIVFAFRNNIV